MSELTLCGARYSGWFGALCATLVGVTSLRGQEGPTQQQLGQGGSEAIDQLILSKLIDDPQAHAALAYHVADRPALSKFWIGVDGVPADDTLRAQLELPDGQGLVLQQVVENSPASKGGLMRHDVLLTADNKPLGQVSDLAAVVQEKGEQSFPIKLVRRGRQIIIEVTPERRPASETGETCPSISDVDDGVFLRRVYLDLIGQLPTEQEVKTFLEDTRENKRERLVNRLLRASTIASKSCTACHAPVDASAGTLLKWIMLGKNPQTHIPLTEREQLKHWLLAEGQSKPLTGTVEMDFFNAAAFVAPQQENELPDDVTISITRSGKRSATIAVKKAEQTWVTTPDKLDQLPDDLRGYVELTLGIRQSPGSRSIKYWLLDAGAKAEPSAVEKLLLGTKIETPPTQPARTAEAIQKIESELDKLAAQFDEFRQALQSLRKSLPAQPSGSDRPASDQDEKK